MTDHAWVQENLAAYLADGLHPDERDQLEQHLAGCADCARAVAEARSLDDRLDRLFAPVRPGPELEDMVIGRLRQEAHQFRGLRLAGWGRVVLGGAAAAVLMMVGAVVSEMLDPQQVGVVAQATNHLKQVGIALQDMRPLDGTSMHLSKTDGTDRYSTYAVDPDGDADKLRTPESLAEELTYQVRVKWKETRSEGGDPNGTDTFGTTVLSAEPQASAGLPAALGKPPMEAARKDPEQGRPAATTPSTGEPSNIPSNGDLNFSPPAAGMGLAGGGGFGYSGKEANGRQIHMWGLVNNSAAPKPGAPTYFSPSEWFGKADAPKDSEKTPPSVPPAGGGAPGAPGTSPEVRAGAVALAQKPKEEQELLEAKPDTSAAGRKIIRSGEVEFEVESFDTAIATVSRLVNAVKGGFVATINSDKLPNGKVRGAAVVRVPPGELDALVLGLRKELGKIGELKSQRIGSQDITKQYTDLESRLKAARTMEERLLKIIRDGKGEIKDLVAAEKELGVWRTRIEETEGEVRYYASQIALSTLTINLYEKEIRVAASVTENERVQAGIEVEDVDKALRAALDAVKEAKGRVTRSEMKQQGAGQFTAQLHFEVEPEAAGPLRDRLRQIGNVVRLEVDRVQQAEGGGKLPLDGKLQHGRTQFMVSLYNLANVAPRETVTVKVAAIDVAEAYRELREAVAKAKGRVVNAQLNEQDRQRVNAQVDFDLRRVDEAVVRAALGAAGEILSRQVARVPEGENVTDAKILYRVELISAASIDPRETVTVAVEVTDVEGTMSVVTSRIKELQGRTLQAHVSLVRSGRVTARVIADVPLASADALVEKIKAAGTVRVHQVSRNPQAPEGKLAVARIDVTLSNVDLLVPRDESLLSQVRHGLSVSFRGLTASIGYLIIGMLFLLPWALLIMAVVWLVRRLWRPRPSAVVVSPAAAVTSTTPPG